MIFFKDSLSPIWGSYTLYLTYTLYVYYVKVEIFLKNCLDFLSLYKYYGNVLNIIIAIGQKILK